MPSLNPLTESFLSAPKSRKAMDFLLFSFFGITCKDTPADILTAAMRRAYRDAASHVLSLCEGVDKERTKAEAMVKIRDFVDALSPAMSQEDYDQQHQALCRQLVESYQGQQLCTPERPFSYGIAQKWVNMTVKYLYLFYWILRDDAPSFCWEYGKTVNQLSPLLHIPIDSYILTAAEKQLGIPPLLCAWSKLHCYQDYLDYQKSIRENAALSRANMTPIDWEMDAWIAIAKTK